jgi:hypothetical protein
MQVAQISGPVAMVIPEDPPGDKGCAVFLERALERTGLSERGEDPDAKAR